MSKGQAASAVYPVSVGLAHSPPYSAACCRRTPYAGATDYAPLAHNAPQPREACGVGRSQAPLFACVICRPIHSITEAPIFNKDEARLLLRTQQSLPKKWRSQPRLIPRAESRRCLNSSVRA